MELWSRVKGYMCVSYNKLNGLLCTFFIGISYEQFSTGAVCIRKEQSEALL